LKLWTLNKLLQSFETSETMNQSTGSNVAQALKLQHLKQNCGQDAIFYSSVRTDWYHTADSKWRHMSKVL